MSQAEQQKDATQTIEIKIITSNEPSAPPKIQIEQPHLEKQANKISQTEQKDMVNQTKAEKKMNVI